MQMLTAYDWPGNIRELENVVQRAIVLSTEPALSLAEAWLPTLEHLPLGDTIALVEIERRHIVNVLQTVGWRIEGRGGAATVLQMKPSTLRSRMAKLGITRPGAAPRRGPATFPESAA
jgi:transcriptional regulator with GAF, ATPase, and Fis domain